MDFPGGLRANPLGWPVGLGRPDQLHTGGVGQKECGRSIGTGGRRDAFVVFPHQGGRPRAPMRQLGRPGAGQRRPRREILLRPAKFGTLCG